MTGPGANVINTTIIFFKRQNTEMTTGIRVFKTIRNYCLVIISFIALCGLPAAYAFNVNITGEFKPDPSNLNHKKFKITSPDVGYCLLYPNFCQTLQLNSLRFTNRFRATAQIEANHSDPRQGAMFQIGTTSSEFTLTNTLNGEQKTVQLKIRGISTKYEMKNGTSVGTLVGMGHYDFIQGHRDLWEGGNWNNAPSPCSNGQISGVYGYSNFSFDWKVTQPGNCAKQALFTIPLSYVFDYPWLEIIYEIITPNPLEMSSGTYTGSLTYTVGPGGDFDLGDVMKTLSGDTILNLNFTLTVLHTLKIEIPPGGNKVELLPQGGWQQWLQGSRLPEKLSRDQIFLISASTPFKMQMTCERTLGDTCAIANALGDEVPIDIYVTLPNGLGETSGASVNHKPLRVSGIGTDHFQATQYVDRTPGILHFEVKKTDVEHMLNQQGVYKGNVTVIWDSEI